MRSNHLYSQEASTVVPLDVNRIKIFQRRLKPQNALSLCPPHVHSLLKFKDQFVEKTQPEIDAEADSFVAVTPYWDSRLKGSRSRRVELYQCLFGSGLLCFRRKRKSTISFFTVRKKDGWQRLILDCRRTNQYHKPPPSTRLSTPSCFADIDMTDETMQNRGFGGILGESIHAAGNEGDVGDCFYNFEIPSLASWFATMDRFSTSELEELGMCPDRIYDDDTGRFEKVVPGEILIPCFQGVPMGWSWALHIANEIVSHQVALACQTGDVAHLKDKQVAPEVVPGRVLVGTYVDNVQVIGGCYEDVDQHMGKIVEWFSKLGIPFTTAGDGALAEFETLGLVFDMEARCIRHRPARAWRLYQATRALLRRGRLRGEVVRVWLGHVIHHFQLQRPAMSSIHACYRFVQAALSKRIEVWPSVRFEMRLVLGLIFLGKIDWTSPFATDVYIGDSSTYGYSLMITEACTDEVKEAMKFQERWRFIEAEENCTSSMLTHSHESIHGYHPSASLGTSTLFGERLAEAHEDFIPLKRWKRVKTGRAVGFEPRGKQLVEVPSLCKPLASHWFKKDRYRLITAKAWKHRSEHINMKEARVSLMGLRRHLRNFRHVGTRLLTLSDNLSSLLAFSKGRSKAFGMNQLVRRSASYCIAGRIVWRLRHVKSADNASDESSRWHDPKIKQQWKAEAMSYSGTHTEANQIPLKVEDVDLDKAPSPRSKSGLPRSLISYLPLFVLELFSGSGRLTSQVAQKGMAWLDPFEIFDGCEFDLTRPKTQAIVLELIKKGLVWYIHAGIPCTVWSRARRGITNHARARAKEQVAVELTLFVVALFRAQSRNGWFWSLENPASSRLFRFPPVANLFSLRDVRFLVWDMCAYGQPFRKSTALLTNLTSLESLAQRCRGGHVHVHLKGREKYVDQHGVSRYRNRTSAAGEYPLDLCQQWSTILSKSAPYAAWASDSSNFKRAFRQRLQEIANIQGSHANGEDAKNYPDLQPSSYPLLRAKRYRKPIVFGQHTAAEAAWLESQGA